MTDLDLLDQGRPLRGAVLCCTSIPPEKRTELAERAEEMGAKHVYDLTSDVTHLIVGEYDTPKYRYVAKERPDVKVLGPDWVDAVRSLWMADQKLDIDALEKLHTMPTFATLRISVTGFEDHAERQRIMDLVQGHGAEYHGNLTKQVTHLLAFKTEGAKYKHAKQWGIYIVSIEWLHDSIERGMILNEKLYHPDLPVEERGKDAWIRQKLPAAPLRKRARADDIAEEGRCKLRRTTSMKLNSESQKMLGDIMVSGAAVANDQTSAGEWEESRQPTVQAPLQQPDEESREENKPAESIFKKPPESRKALLFTNCQFHLYGFSDKKRKVIESFLLSHDARLIHTLEALEQEVDTVNTETSYILIPHDLPVLERPLIPETLSSIPIVTEFWVENCYNLKSIQDPATHSLARPFPKFPISKFSGMIISSTAFTGFELLHVAKAVELLGAKYNEYLTPKHSVLICASSKFLKRDKFDYANRWKIPVVKSKWLWDSIDAGEKQPLRNYLYRAKTDAMSTTASDCTASRSSSVDPKARSMSGQSSDLADKAPLDDDADTTLEIKAEDDSTPLEFDTSDLPAEEPTTKPPLGEASGNTALVPTPPIASAPAPVEVPRADIDNAINTLLAKGKPSSNPTSSEAVDGKKPRSRTRILGRVASNVSATSAASLESSVDSTATIGNAVHWPKEKRAADGESQESLQLTQLGWEEEQSAEAKDRITSMVKGDVGGKKSRPGVKERAVTLGDLNETPRTNRSGARPRPRAQRR